MSLNNKKIGIAFTGSFCTYKRIFKELENLINEGAQVHTIFSNAAQTLDSRFGNAKDFMKKAEEMTGIKPILTIPEAEPIGPKAYLDAMVIFPCTGNTLAKLANGITDGPVLMAAKAQLRNELPLILAISTNDALSMNLKNIGILMNAKNIYFLPFGQDDCIKKPNSMVAHLEMLVPTIEQALIGKQIQPIIKS